MSAHILSAAPVETGDALVEVVGGEVRFWTAYRTEEGLLKVKMVGRSFPFMRQRILQSIDGKTGRNAPELTSARIYSSKNRTGGAMIALDAARELTPDAQRVHLFYAGCGPSGTRWGWQGDNHYSFSG